MSNGEEELATEGRVLKENRGSIGLSVDVLPSMPKGETVGIVVIDGKGDDKGGAPETSFKGQRGSIRNKGIEAEATKELETEQWS